MNDSMRAGMTEALRLTRAGRLADATAVIRRSLGSLAARAVPENATERAAEPSDVSYRVVGDKPAPRRTADAVPLPAPAGPALAPDPALVEAQPEGRVVKGSYSSRAGRRAYQLYVPSGYTGQPVPLVVMLHGCTQGADDSAAGTRLNMLAEEDPFLVVYPEQAAAATSSRCWTWFTRANQQPDRGEPSLIAGITRQVMATHNVDCRRVYVAGMSAGGAMAAILGATYPDLYAAVGVHSGLAHGAARNLRSAYAAMQRGADDPVVRGEPDAVVSVPTIVFHGDRDTTVNPRNGEQVLAQALAHCAGGAPAPRMGPVRQ